MEFPDFSLTFLVFKISLTLKKNQITGHPASDRWKTPNAAYYVYL